MVSSTMEIRNAVLRATDPKLRTDNWQYILDVCDLVKEDPEDNGQEVMDLIEKRLEQQDANVILRTLSLMVSLAENCGSRLRQDISSKHFTSLLYALIDSHSVHITLKKAVADTVKQLADSFKDDPSLRSMGDLYDKIKRKAPYLVKQPNVPEKHNMTTTTDNSDDEELQKALKMSLFEYEKQKKLQEQEKESAGALSQQQQQQQQQQLNQAPMHTTPVQTIVRRVRALYDLSTNEPDELSFRKDDVIIVLEQVYRDWWKGALRGKMGIFPLNYVTPIAEPSKEEIENEKNKEAVILSQKTAVDQLHTSLNAASKTGDSNEVLQDPHIGDMYGSVTPLRPQVTRMLGKYAKEKEDMLSLRQVLANAEHTYNQLMDRAANAHISPQAAVPAFYTGIPNNDVAPAMPPQRQSYHNHQYASYPPNQPIQNSPNGRTNTQYGYDMGYSVVSQPPPDYEQ
ncbi:Hse1p [Saccharomyces cerevisiae x Saccharomyces kudriavzevii VIN7]|uniref:Class E vacuolar protein-sorting machinery protein HSE1 n=1 Tax=Saccharomyces cerevisiae x Saccharomyces kudriavzevii (strain VIN7) TaxID=1095631 RepID=H0GVL5_SACCK|nr:Hse1p [Saccharomyces cerevisiae x Saccharomyces kudriavzevii VIN7]